MDIKDIIWNLETFNKNAEALLKSSLLKRLAETKISLHIKKGFPTTVSKIGPKGGDEDLDAFILKYRLLFQNNDPVSFGNMAKIYEEEIIPQEIKDNFREARKRWNNFLDSDPPIKLNNEPKNRRELHDTFLYGGLAHNDKSKTLKVNQWKKSRISWSFLEGEFTFIMQDMFKFMAYVKQLNSQVLEVLKKVGKNE